MEQLTDYLNDHLAGSVGALELLDRLIEACQGKPLERFFRDLREDIHQDQEQLKGLMQKLGVAESAVRKAGAWIAEKLSRPKIELEDGSKEEIGIFLALEALALAGVAVRVSNNPRTRPARLFRPGETGDRAVRESGGEAAGHRTHCLPNAVAAKLFPFCT